MSPLGDLKGFLMVLVHGQVAVSEPLPFLSAHILEKVSDLALNTWGPGNVSDYEPGPAVQSQNHFHMHHRTCHVEFFHHLIMNHKPHNTDVSPNNYSITTSIKHTLVLCYEMVILHCATLRLGFHSI